MFVRHGSALIAIAAFGAVAVSGVGFVLTQSVTAALGLAAVVLFLVAVLANRSGPLTGRLATAPSGQSPRVSLLTQPSPLAVAGLLYITAGSLIVVWSGVWYEYYRVHPPSYGFVWYLCYGFLGTGFVLLLIGLSVGRIGRSARQAELPPEESLPAALRSQQAAAVRGPATHP
jgi:hypothetical protein